MVNFILDKSGSMESVRDATISGFNEYLGTLRKDRKSEYEFTLTLFDTLMSSPVLSQPLDKVKDLTRETYVPNGMTALYDAVCSAIRVVVEKKDQKVVFIIMTDGEENSSKEHDRAKMKELIEERTKKGNWTFVYLGANQDSYANAQKMGIKTMNTSNFNSTPVGMAAAMRSVADNTVAYAASSGGQTNAFFSRDAQDAMEDAK